jgi:hypothetical protein
MKRKRFAEEQIVGVLKEASSFDRPGNNCSDP